MTERSKTPFTATHIIFSAILILAQIGFTATAEPLPDCVVGKPEHVTLQDGSIWVACGPTNAALKKLGKYGPATDEQRTMAVTKEMKLYKTYSPTGWGDNVRDYSWVNDRSKYGDPADLLPVTEEPKQ